MDEVKQPSGLISEEKQYIILNGHQCYEQQYNKFSIERKELDICQKYKVSLR